jgi:hypothetical protein
VFTAREISANTRARLSISFKKRRRKKEELKWKLIDLFIRVFYIFFNHCTMNEAINERLDAARAELLAALEAHLAFPPHGGNARGRADSQARVDAASAEVERLRKAMRLLGNAPEAAHAPAPAPAVARAAPVPKELGEKILHLRLEERYLRLGPAGTCRSSRRGQSAGEETT